MNTHILVSIEEMNAFLNTIPNVSGYLAKGRFLDSCPQVDLSKEGVKGRAIKNTLKKQEMSGDPLQYQNGYQQCADDLLNSK